MNIPEIIIVTSVCRAMQEEFSILPIQRYKSLAVGCIQCSEDEREHSERNEGAQVYQWQSRQPVCQRTSMRQYASSFRKKNSGCER